MSDSEPTVAICTTCRNAELTIGYCIDSIMKLNYPKEKLVYIIVDSQSSDNTREIADRILSRKNIKHIIINKKCTISEGRNICIGKALELSIDYLFFIDADEFILDPNLLRELIILSTKNKNSVLFVPSPFKNFFNREEMEKFIKNISIEQKDREYVLNSEKWAGTGLFFSSVNILKDIKFSEELNFLEDIYFGYELKEKGYKVKVIKSDEPLAFDLNVTKYSDIYIKISVRDYLRALNKKSFSLAYKNYEGSVLSSLIKFIKSEDGRRAGFHMFYAITILFGLLLKLVFNERIGISVAVFGVAVLVLWTVRMRIRRCRNLRDAFSYLLKYSIFGIHSFFYVPLFLIINKNKFKKLILNNTFAQR